MPTFELRDACAPVHDPILGSALEVDNIYIQAVNQANAIAKLMHWCEQNGWRECDTAQFGRQCANFVKTITKLAKRQPELTQIQNPRFTHASCVDMFIQILTQHRVLHHVHVKNERVRHWRDSMKRSVKTGGRAACRWTAALAQKPPPISFRDPETNMFTDNLSSMFEELARVWNPIFNTFQGQVRAPNWNAFRETFGPYLPQASTPLLEPLEGDKMFKIAKQMSKARAGGLDA